MAATAEAPKKAGFDIGDVIRIGMVLGMIWLTVEAPETKTLPPPYAQISLAAYYAAIATALFTPQFWARFGQKRAAGDAVILPGDRLFQIVALLGLIAATPQTLLWAVETPTSEPWSLGFYWLCVVLFAGFALLCLRNLLRSNDLIRVDDQGIAAPRLWRGSIPWHLVKGASQIGGRNDSALLIQFEAPTEVAMMPRPFLDWGARLGTEKRSVTIPGILLGMPAEKMAGLIEERVRAR